METLKISKANALLAFEGATIKQKSLLSNLFGKQVFLKSAIERIKSYEDACSDIDRQPLTIGDFDFLPEGDRKHAFASHQLTTINKALNEGWIPDWSNSNELKYYGWFKYAGSGSGFSFNDYNYDNTNSNVSSQFATYNIMQRGPCQHGKKIRTNKRALVATAKKTYIAKAHETIK